MSQHILQEHKSETIVKWWCHHCNENKWAEEAWFQRHLKSCKHLHEKSKSGSGNSRIRNPPKNVGKSLFEPKELTKPQNKSDELAKQSATFENVKETSAKNQISKQT